MSEDNLSPLFQRIAEIRSLLPDVDIQKSGLASDVIETIEKLDTDHSKITVIEIAQYLRTLGYQLEFKTSGMGRLSEQPQTFTISIVQIPSKIVPVGQQPAPA